MARLVQMIRQAAGEERDAPGACPVCEMDVRAVAEHVRHIHGDGGMRRSIVETTYEVDEDDIALLSMIDDGPSRRRAWLDYLAQVEAESPGTPYDVGAEAPYGEE